MRSRRAVRQDAVEVPGLRNVKANLTRGAEQRQCGPDAATFCLVSAVVHGLIHISGS